MKIRSAQNVGKVFISRKKTFPAPFGALPGHFLRGPEKSKKSQNFAYFPWWALAAIHPRWGYWYCFTQMKAVMLDAGFCEESKFRNNLLSCKTRLLIGICHLRKILANSRRFVILLRIFGHSMALFGVRRGFKMILSHRAPPSLNMSSYRAI